MPRKRKTEKSAPEPSDHEEAIEQEAVASPAGEAGPPPEQVKISDKVSQEEVVEHVIAEGATPEPPPPGEQEQAPASEKFDPNSWDDVAPKDFYEFTGKMVTAAQTVKTAGNWIRTSLAALFVIAGALYFTVLLPLSNDVSVVKDRSDTFEERFDGVDAKGIKKLETALKTQKGFIEANGKKADETNKELNSLSNSFGEVAQNVNSLNKAVEKLASLPGEMKKTRDFVAQFDPTKTLDGALKDFQTETSKNFGIALKDFQTKTENLIADLQKEQVPEGGPKIQVASTDVFKVNASRIRGLTFFSLEDNEIEYIFSNIKPIPIPEILESATPPIKSFDFEQSTIILIDYESRADRPDQDKRLRVYTELRANYNLSVDVNVTDEDGVYFHFAVKDIPDPHDLNGIRRLEDMIFNNISLHMKIVDRDKTP